MIWFCWPGCHVSAQSTSANRPSLTMNAFPTRVSSAGHPRNRTVPLTSPRRIASRTAIAAAAAAVPRRLWPHPWPGPFGTIGLCSVVPRRWLKPGRASNSPSSAMTGVPSPYVATNAVGMPATPRSTANPDASSASASAALLLVSCNPSSGVSQIRSLNSANCGACAVTKSSTDANGMHAPPRVARSAGTPRGWRTGLVERLLPRRVDRRPLFRGHDAHALEMAARHDVEVLGPEEDPRRVLPDRLLRFFVDRLPLLRIHGRLAVQQQLVDLGILVEGGDISVWRPQPRVEHSEQLRGGIQVRPGLPQHVHLNRGPVRRHCERADVARPVGRLHGGLDPDVCELRGDRLSRLVVLDVAARGRPERNAEAVRVAGLREQLLRAGGIKRPAPRLDPRVSEEIGGGRRFEHGRQPEDHAVDQCLLVDRVVERLAHARV